MPLDQVSSMAAAASNHTTKVRKIFKSRSAILSRMRSVASSIPDFRRQGKGNIRHRLDVVIVLMILGRLSGHIGNADIIEFGRFNLRKFQKIGMLRNGVPSEPTLCRIEDCIDGVIFAHIMQEFVGKYHEELLDAINGMEIICVDGKAQRGTIQENGRNPDIQSQNLGISGH